MNDDIRPDDFGIDAGYRHFPGDRAEDHIGPFFYRATAPGRVASALRIGGRHCNVFGIVHGGVLMAFADYTLCLAAMESGSDAVITVSATCDFTDAAREGELLCGEGEVVRVGGSLVFTRCIIRSGDRPVLSASGVIKRLRRPVTS